MTAASDLRGLPRVALRGDEAPGWTALLTALARPVPVGDDLFVTLRPADETWSSGEVNAATCTGGVSVAYEILSYPQELPAGLRMDPVRTKALPAGIRGLSAALAAERIAGAQLRAVGFVHAGFVETAAQADRPRFVLELHRGGALHASVLIAVALRDLSALAAALGFSAAPPESAGDDMPVAAEPRIARVMLAAGEAAALAPGDIVMLGRLPRPFDAIRIGGVTCTLRDGPDGGVILGEPT